jgi:formylglycine-generating enzyme required for sulfatase activity
VRLTRGFWIGQTEVTNAAYRRYLTARNAPADSVPQDNMPARGLNWLDAADYCARAGGRLPTEAEWEYAARGGERARRYVTGDTLDERQISLGMAPRPVGSYSPNGFGVFDMTGNVAEWTRSRGNTLYDYYGRGSYSDAEPLVDPEFEPRAGEPIVVRGGSYSSISRELQLHYGTLSPFDTQEETIGLRCVLEGSELEMVAAAYRINPFFEPYSAYHRFFPYSRGIYQSWWYSLYVRYLGAEQWRRSQ